MAIVMPLPFQPASYSGPTLYADWMACGVKQRPPDRFAVRLGRRRRLDELEVGDGRMRNRICGLRVPGARQRTRQSRQARKHARERDGDEQPSLHCVLPPHCLFLTSAEFLRLGMETSEGRRACRREPCTTRYLTSESILNIGKYIAITMTPTISPTRIIINGSTIDVSDWIAASTSSS